MGGCCSKCGAYMLGDGDGSEAKGGGSGGGNGSTPQLARVAHADSFSRRSAANGSLKKPSRCV
jgi:hypothetical protein